MKKGVLLVNLGTPDACETKAIRRYLREFLLDPRVVDLPWVVRQILVNGIIIPFRAKKTTEAYQKIWTKEGSPLLVNNMQLTETLAKALGENYQVALGMRYGNPSITSALQQLKDCSSLFILPLFPQYATATTGSAIAKIFQQMLDISVDLQIRSSFYNAPLFINAYAEKIKGILKDNKPDLLLFSYHGLPERQLNSNNYRTQCHETSHLIAEQLKLSQDQYTVSFQSRLGKTPWIKPYTDEVLPELRKNEIKNIAVISPSFVTDCLETLEEIDIRLREQWFALGGESFTYISALNDDPLWISALKEWMK